MGGFHFANLPAMQHEFNNKSLVQVLCDHIAAVLEREAGESRESSQLWVFVSLFFFYSEPLKPPESSQLLVRVCVSVS